MTRRPNRAAWASAAGLFTVAAIVGLGARPVASQDSSNDSGPPLALHSQNFTVSAGGTLHFEYVVNEDVPEITTTTTTTTSTTTTTTTTLAPPVTFPPDHPYAGAAIPPEILGDFPELTTPTTPPVAAETTTTTTLPPGPAMTVRVSTGRAITERGQVTRAKQGRPGGTVDSVEYLLDDVAELVEGVRRLALDVRVGGTVSPAGVDQDDQVLLLPDPGLYPVTVEIRRDGHKVVDHVTFVERLPDGGGPDPLGPFRLAVVAGIDDPGPDVTEQELLRARPQLIELAAVARSVGSGITAAIPPSVADPLFATDQDLAAGLNEALASSELVVLPAVPLDASSAAAADAVDPTLADQPAASLAARLAALRDEGARQLAQRLPAVTQTDSVWLVDEPVTTAGADLLAGLGVTTLVVPFDHYADLAGDVAKFTDPSLLSSAALGAGTALTGSSGATIDLALVDPATALLDPDRASTDTPFGDAVQLLASMSAIRQQLGPEVRGFVLALDDFGVPDADVLTDLVGLAAGHPGFSFVRLSELAGPGQTNHFFVNGTPLMVGLDAFPAHNLAPRVTRVRALQLGAVDAASMLPTDDARLGLWSMAFATAVSTGLDDVAATAVLDESAAQIDAVRTAVLAPEAYPFTLLSRRASVRLRIPNTSATPLKVVVRLTAEKLAMRCTTSCTPGGDLEVTLEPEHVNEIDVEVEARSNGAFPVVAEVFSPLGNRLTERVELQARVNALSGLGWVVTAGAGLVLLSWWYSHLRRRHRARREEYMAASLGRHPATFSVTATPRPFADDANAVELVTPAPAPGATIDATTDSLTDTTVVPVDPAEHGPIDAETDAPGKVSDP